MPSNTLDKWFLVADPSSPEASARKVHLYAIYPDEVSSSYQIILEWDFGSARLYDKLFNDEASMLGEWRRLDSDVSEVEKLNVENKIEEAVSLMDSLIKRYKMDSVTKEAKVVVQNIFFTTPEEAAEYAKTMAGGEGDVEQLPAAETLPLAEEVADNITLPAPSFDAVEEEKARSEKDITKRIETEVKDQLATTLESKKATLFTDADKALVNAMRAVGRTWEEVAEYMKKSLKYDADSVALLLDDMRVKETTPAPEAGVSEEVKEKLLEEIKQDVVDAKASIVIDLTKNADSNPLFKDLPKDDVLPTPEPIKPAEEEHDVVDGDRVYVVSEPGKLGYEGVVVDLGRRDDGTSFALVKANGNTLEVPVYMLVKIAADKPTKLKQLKIAPPHIDRDVAAPATPEVSSLVGEVHASLNRLDAIKAMVAQLEAQFKEKKKQIEEQGGKVQHEQALQGKLEALAALMDKVDSGLVYVGDTMLALKKEEAITGVDTSAQWKLAKLYEKYKGAEGFIEKAVKEAKDAANKELLQELIMFPKKMSKVHKAAGLLDELQDLYDVLKDAVSELVDGIKEAKA